MTPLIPFDYSFIVLMQSDLLTLSASEINITIELLQPQPETDDAELENIFSIYSDILDSGALTDGDPSPNCRYHQAGANNHEQRWVLEQSSAFTQSGMTVLLNLLQERQQQVFLKKITLRTGLSQQPTKPPTVCEEEHEAYTPIPDSPPFAVEIDDVVDLVNLYIRFETTLSSVQKAAVKQALQGWLVGFGQGGYRTAVANSDDYGLWQAIVCIDDEVEWTIEDFQGSYAAVESFVHIGWYLHQAVAPIAELYVE